MDLRPKGSIVRLFGPKSMNGRPVGPQEIRFLLHPIPGPKDPGWKNGWTVGPKNHRSRIEETLPFRAEPIQLDPQWLAVQSVGVLIGWESSVMWNDPIVAEVHRAREKLAAECNFDIKAFFAGVRGVGRCYADQPRRLRAEFGRRTIPTQAYAERDGQLDPQSPVVQSVGVLIGSPLSIAGKLP